MAVQSNITWKNNWSLSPIKFVKLLFKKYQQINVSQAKSMINGGGIIVIDARKSKDHHESHIKGALSMEGNVLSEFIDRTDKSSHIICYCYKGISSKGLCRKLVQAGFKNVYNLKGGFNAWRKK